MIPHGPSEVVVASPPIPLPPEGPPREAFFADAARRHYRLVFSIAHQILGSARDAEDAAQETFLRALRALPSLASAGSIASWLGAIARTTAIDAARRRARLERRLGDGQVEHADDGGERPLARVERLDDAARIRASLAALPEHEQVVVTLRFLEGLTPVEIAGRLGLAAGAVRVRLHRAMKRLRDVLGDEEADEEPRVGTSPAQPEERTS